LGVFDQEIRPGIGYTHPEREVAMKRLIVLLPLLAGCNYMYSTVQGTPDRIAFKAGNRADTQSMTADAMAHCKTYNKQAVFEGVLPVYPDFIYHYACR